MVIDIHSHILPGIDDGSRNADESLNMLKKEAETGTDLVVFTPHYYVNHTNLERFLEKRSGAFEKMKEAYRELQEPFPLPKMRWGAEVAYYRGVSQLEGLEKLCISKTDMLLLEMPFGPWNEEVLREIREIQENRQLRVMLAHVERFTEYPGNLKKIEKLMEGPCYIQVNAEALLHFSVRRRVLKWMEEDAVQFLGSDCHRLDFRPPNLHEGREVIEKKLGKEWLQEFDADAARILRIKE